MASRTFSASTTPPPTPPLPKTNKRNESLVSQQHSSEVSLQSLPSTARSNISQKTPTTVVVIKLLKNIAQKGAFVISVCSQNSYFSRVACYNFALRSLLQEFFYFRPTYSFYKTVQPSLHLTCSTTSPSFQNIKPDIQRRLNQKSCVKYSTNDSYC